MSKHTRVELGISSKCTVDEARNILTEISNRLPGFFASNVIVDEIKVSFNISTQPTEDVNAKEIGSQLKRLTESINLPPKVEGAKVVVSDMWSW